MEANTRYTEAFLSFFDRDFYLELYRDVRLAGVDPLDHYLQFGKREGRMPNLAFCPLEYATVHPKYVETGMEPLEHFLLKGREAGLSGRWNENLTVERVLDDSMDVDHYEEQLGHFLEHVTPGLHYNKFGQYNDLNPVPYFDARYYMKEHPDVARARKRGVPRANPFYHYVSHGQFEGRLPTPTGRGRYAPAPFTVKTPAPGYLGADHARADVVVVVPVYKQVEFTRTCLSRVIGSSVTRPFSLLVVNDASPDPDMAAMLDAMQAEHGFELLDNVENVGFVRTVNRALVHLDAPLAANDVSDAPADPAEPAKPDVILLNSDAFVYGDWIDRMLAVADAREDLATITPLSNCATIMSYPFAQRDCEFDLELPFPELDMLVAGLDAEPVPIITGVGFAMFVSGRARAQIGNLDEAGFGRGYGEEVDFCLKAARAGLENYGLPNVFVAHYGEASFEGDEAEKAAGSAALNARYAGFDRDVQDYIKGDPLTEHRTRIDLARLRRMVDDHAGCVVHVTHSWGGGIARYVEDLTRLATAENKLSLVISAKNGQVGLSVFGPDTRYVLPNLESLNVFQIDDVLGAVMALPGLDAAFLNSVTGWPDWAVRKLEAAWAASKAPRHYVIHDYTARCLRSNFVMPNGLFCGGYETVQKCQRCVGADNLEPTSIVPEHHALFDDLLAACDAVIAPSDAAAVVFEGITGRAPTVLRHDYTLHAPADAIKADPSARPEGPLKIVMMGGIGVHKGSRELRRLIHACNARGIAAEFTVHGEVDDADSFAGLPNFRMTGRYNGDGALHALLEADPPDLALFLSIWPETYLYTLSLAMELGLPAMGYDIGAQGERLNGYSRGLTVAMGANRYAALAAKIGDGRTVGRLRAAPLTHDLVAYRTLADYLAALRGKPHSRKAKPPANPKARRASASA